MSLISGSALVNGQALTSSVALGYTPPPLTSYDPAPASTGYQPWGTNPINIPANTQVPGTNLFTDANGHLRVNQPVTISDVIINGYIEVTAPVQVTLNRVKIRDANNVQTNHGLITATTLNSFVYAYDCELIPANPSVWINAFYVHNGEFWRCNVQRCVDGLRHKTNVVNTISVFGCYMGNAAYSSPDNLNHPNDSPISKTHNDVGGQIEDNLAGSQIVFRGNTIDGWCEPGVGQIDYSAANPDPVTGGYNDHYPNRQANSAFQLTGKATGLVVDNNKLSGGGYCINGAAGMTGTIAITNNRFVPDQRVGRMISIPSTVTLTASGNTNYNTGAAVNAVRF